MLLALCALLRRVLRALLLLLRWAWTASAQSSLRSPPPALCTQRAVSPQKQRTASRSCVRDRPCLAPAPPALPFIADLCMPSRLLLRPGPGRGRALCARRCRRRVGRCLHPKPSAGVGAAATALVVLTPQSKFDTPQSKLLHGCVVLVLF